jgi:hypothetical protein
MVASTAAGGAIVITGAGSGAGAAGPAPEAAVTPVGAVSPEEKGRKSVRLCRAQHTALEGNLKERKSIVLFSSGVGKKVRVLPAP